MASPCQPFTGPMQLTWLTDFFNDLHMFDPVDMTWTDLSAKVSGTTPAPRYGHCFAAAGGVLLAYGGHDQNGQSEF